MDADPVLHALHASVLAAITSDESAYASWTFYVIERDGWVPFLAHHTPPFPIHMPTGDAGCAAALAEFVHAAGEQPTAIGGHRTSVEAFASRWRRLTGQGTDVLMRLGMYDLPGDVTLPRPVRGKARLATADDLDLVRGWLEAYHEEIPAYRGRVVHVDDARVLEGRTMLWCDPEPVAMAQVTSSGPGVVPIAGVYTPPAHRGHGYGSAVTAAISRDRQAHGDHCMLYTDLDNPTSNGIYAAMGYRFLADSVELVVRDPAE